MTRRVLLVAHTGRPAAERSAQLVAQPPGRRRASRAGASPDEAQRARADRTCELVPPPALTAERRLRAGHRARRRRHVPARAPSSPARPGAAARRQPRPRSGSSPRPSRTTSTSTVERVVEPQLRRRGADDARRHRRARRPADRRRLGAQRGDRREGRRERMLEVVVEVDGRPLSRWGCDGVVLRHPDRLDGVRVLRRRPGGLARGRGAAARADQRARAVRPAAGHVAPHSTCWRSRCCPHTPRRRALVRRPPHRSTCRRGRGSRCGGALARCGWPGCIAAPFTDRLVAKFALPVQGWRGRPGAGDRADGLTSAVCWRRCASAASA